MEAPETVIASTIGAMLYGAAGKNVQGKVLDVRCGNKPYKRFFPECEWIGIDSRPVGDIAGSLEDFPIPDDTFDVVLCLDALSFVFSPMRTVRECYRVLKPGGFFAAAVRNIAPDDDEILWKFSKRGLDFLVSSAGFDEIQLVSDGGIIGAEWGSMANFEKYSIHMSADVTGWLEQMNKRYHAVSFVMARKL